MGPSLDHHRWTTSSLEHLVFTLTTTDSTFLALGIAIIAGAPLHHHHHQLFSSGKPLPSSREHLITLTTIDSTSSSSALGITTGGPPSREHLFVTTTIDSTSSSLDAITIAGPSPREHLFIIVTTIDSTRPLAPPPQDHHRRSTSSSSSPPSTRLARVRTPSPREHLITLTTIDSTCSSWTSPSSLDHFIAGLFPSDKFSPSSGHLLSTSSTWIFLNLALRFAQRIKNLGRALRARPKKSRCASKMSTAAARRLTFLRNNSMTAASRPSLEIASGDFKEDPSSLPLHAGAPRRLCARALRARALRIQQIFLNQREMKNNLKKWKEFQQGSLRSPC
ncbi:hypothetical protein TYRP_010324 [Tyrophagus putrescentiae]|nr:hypothetical protein TYRP_010324 [Tyrophagus putrescentiae]